MTEIKLGVNDPSERQCGDCTLCCKLVPVRELDKGAGQRCLYQRHGAGCTIYAHRPMSCQLWSCLWYADAPRTADLRRPDRSHYVIDIFPDFVEVTGGEETIRLDVVVVWVDPKYPDAHRDPALRAMLERQRSAALIRYSATDGFVIFPPELSPTGRWWERRREPGDSTTGEHTVEEILGGFNVEEV